MDRIQDFGPEPKIRRVLRALLQRPHTSRDLELAPVSDHCSHSTVSDLRAEGVEIETERVTVPGYAGQPAHVARWEIPAHAREHALQLLHELGRRRRGDR